MKFIHINVQGLAPTNLKRGKDTVSPVGGEAGPQRK
jgi:hypothetical protein